MTPKQQRFVEEYLVDLNASAAARRAGYSERTAFRIGQENMQKPAIAQAIAEARAKLSESTGRTVEAVMEDILRIGKKAEDAEDWAPALKARELEAKHLGAFTERVQLTGKDGELLGLRVTFEKPKPAEE